MRLCSTDKRDWWRIAQIVNWITRCTKELFCSCRGHDRIGDNGGRCVEHLHWLLVLFRLVLHCWPNIRFAILATTYDVLRIIAEGGMNLAARIFISLEFELESFVPQVVNPYPRVVACYEQFDFGSWRSRWIVDRLYAGDLTSFGILPMRRSHMDLCLIFQPIGFIK